MLEILMLIFVVFFETQILMHSQLNKYMLKVAFSVLTLIAFLARFGLKKDKNFFKRYTIIIVLIHISVALIIAYLLGLFVGFNRSLFSTSFRNIIFGLGFTIIDVISIEIVRYIVCKESFENKKPIVFYTLLMIVLEILLQKANTSFNNGYDIFEFICVYVITTIAREALCSYLTYNISIVPSLIYSLLVNIYIYVLPIVPALSPFLYSMLFLVLPFSVYRSIQNILNKYDKEHKIVKEKIGKILFWPIFIFLIIIVILVAGIFRYKMIAIVSNSMNPYFYRGDAIIYEKAKADDIREGDVLVFIRDGKIITHRVVKKINTNDNTLFVTKGDNNNANDEGYVYSKDVLGKGKSVVKYIGYPTVLVSEFFEKE